MTPNIIDETVYKENDPHKTPTPITGPSATPNKGAGIGLAIKMTLQSSTNTLLSSQTTTARPTRTTPAGRPAPTGSKGITYTNPATNANPPQTNTPKTLGKQANHRRVANTQKPPHRQQQTTRDQAKYTVKNVSPGVSRPPTRDSNRHADPRRGCHCRSQSSGRTEASAARGVGITMRISSQYDGPHWPNAPVSVRIRPVCNRRLWRMGLSICLFVRAAPTRWNLLRPRLKSFSPPLMCGRGVHLAARR